MCPNWNNAVPQQVSSYTYIDSALGAHNAHMIGFTETWTETNSCYNCKQSGLNSECKKCKGTGSSTDEYIGIKYEMPDGRTEQERVTFKISEPRVYNGQAIRSSKLYDRLIEFSKHDGNDPFNPETSWGPGQLAEWARTHQSSAHVPVLVIIKQPGKYPKITEVLYREERRMAPTASEVVAHRQPPRDIQEITERAKANAEDNVEVEIPF